MVITLQEPASFVLGPVHENNALQYVKPTADPMCRRRRKMRRATSNHTRKRKMSKNGTTITVMVLAHSKIMITTRSMGNETSHLPKETTDRRMTHRKLTAKIHEKPTDRAFKNRGDGSIASGKREMNAMRRLVRASRVVSPR
jgi:hypothetical protein